MDSLHRYNMLLDTNLKGILFGKYQIEIIDHVQVEVIFQTADVIQFYKLLFCCIIVFLDVIQCFAIFSLYSKQMNNIHKNIHSGKK